MKKLYTFLVLCGLCFTQLHIAIAQETKSSPNTVISTNSTPERILFVGNSYTYFWNLPQQVMILAHKKQIDMQTFQSTRGGSKLEEHWLGEHGLTTRDIIKQGDFDAVVLQDHSLRSIQAPQSLNEYGKNFVDLIKETGAKPYLYLTWAREYAPEMQTTITQEYTKLALQTGATLVPVGLAWQRARTLRPEIKLYDVDKTHPSLIGSYLSACVFYGAFTHNNPIGLERVLRMKDSDGRNFFLNVLSANDALFLQQVAAQILKENGFIKSVEKTH